MSLRELGTEATDIGQLAVIVREQFVAHLRAFSDQRSAIGFPVFG
jgi:hypothetical protein